MGGGRWARLDRQWGSCRGLWLPRQQRHRLWVCTDMHAIVMKRGRVWGEVWTGCGLGWNGRGWPAGARGDWSMIA